MLEPQQRRLLLDALRPPEGYELQAAVGTTYSLDLVAVLSTPLAFSLFDLQDSDGEPAADPIALLEALRRHIDRISIFCQAGGIAVPRKSKLLFGYLEDSVHEVVPPDAAGVFHPKVWLLRFSSASGAVRYRLLCGTRNLTYDRSWDSLLVLEGELSDRKNAYSMNHPLGEFFETLPELCVRPLAAERATEVQRMAYEVRRVQFEPPEGFDQMRFHPLGLGRHKNPFDGRVDRLLVVSPFLSRGFFDATEGRGRNNVLISRLDALKKVPAECLSEYEDVYVFDSDLDSPDASDEGGENQAEAAHLTGLHAKLYIADAGYRARLWTGSANATSAAFHRNVEFLVELEGKKGFCGIDALLRRTDGNVDFADFLRRYEPDENPAAEDEETEDLEARLTAAQCAIARMQWRADVREESGSFRIVLMSESAASAELEEMDVRCWPITLSIDTYGREPEWGNAPGALCEFGPVSFEAITSFFAFEITASSAAGELSRRFVINAELAGVPSDRRERLLYSLLQNQAEVLRYLLLLLSDDPLDLLGGEEGGNGPGWFGSLGTGGLAFGLLEPLLRTLARNPEKLDRVARLVSDLRSSEKGRDLLPEGFDELWDAVSSAYLERTKWARLN